MNEGIFLYTKADELYATHLLKEIRTFQTSRRYQRLSSKERKALQNLRCLEVHSPDCYNHLRESSFLIVLCTSSLIEEEERVNQLLKFYASLNNGKNEECIIPVIDAYPAKHELLPLLIDVRIFMPSFLKRKTTIEDDEFLGSCVQQRGEERVIQDVVSSILEVDNSYFFRRSVCCEWGICTILFLIILLVVIGGKPALLATGIIFLVVSGVTCLYLKVNNVPFFSGIQLLLLGMHPSSYTTYLFSALQQGNHDIIPLLVSALSKNVKILKQLHKSLIENRYDSLAVELHPYLLSYYQQELHKAGIDFDSVTEFWPDLIKNGEILTIEMVLLAKGNPNSLLKNKQTPLHLAAKFNNLQIVKLLLQWGAATNLRNSTNRLPIDYAVSDCKTLLCAAASEQLNKWGITPNNYKENILKLCHKDDIDSVAQIVAAGWDLSYHTSETSGPLYLAASIGKMKLLEFLISRKITKQELHDALVEVAGNGTPDVLSFLILNNADVDSSDLESAFIDAIFNGKVENVRRLCKAGVNINCKQANTGFTPLMVSVFSGMHELIPILVDAGADVNELDASGMYTPLTFAIARSHTEELAIAYMKELIVKGADVNLCSGLLCKRSPLMSAISAGKTEIVQFLLEQNVCVNLVSEDGMTALDYAVEKNNLLVAQALITKGACLNKGKDNGVESLSQALRHNNEEMLNLILESQEDIDPQVLDEARERFYIWQTISHGYIADVVNGA